MQRLANNLGGKIEFRGEEGKGSVFVTYLRKYVKQKVKLTQPINAANLANLDDYASRLK